MKIRLRTLRTELNQSATRVHEAGKGKPEGYGQQLRANRVTNVNFEKELKQLEQSVLSLGEMVESAVRRSVEALKRRDAHIASQIIEGDQELDRKVFAVQEKCMQLIATGYPSGGDLRIIVGVLGIITELERMGDYAEGIANITLMIGDQPPLKPLIDIPRMAQTGIEMLRGSLEAFLARDVERAKQICQMDDEVDGLYDQVFRELLLFMIKDPKTITQATWLIWVAHNLERLADRVTNICEQAVFSTTGQRVDIGASKY